MLKYTQDNVDKVTENIGRVKEFADNLSHLTSTDSTKFWASLKGILVRVKESHEASIKVILDSNNNDHPGNTLGSCKAHSGAIKVIDYIFEVIDKNEGAVGQASARLKELKEELKEINDNIEAQQ